MEKLLVTIFIAVILAGCDDGHRYDPLLGRWEHDHPVSLFVLQFHRSDYHQELGGYSNKVTLKDEGGTYEAIGDYHFDQNTVRIKFANESALLFGTERFSLRRVSQNRICTVLRRERWCFDYAGG